MLTVPTADDCEQVRVWRNRDRSFLRTPYFLTEEMQEGFYRDVICNRASPHRYYSFVVDNRLVAFGGLTNLQWENSIAEISLIVSPQVRGKGIGQQAVGALLDEGFGNLGLLTIYGEVYGCGHVGFWRKMCDRFDGQMVTLPWRTKLWQGRRYQSTLFAFEKSILI